MSSYKKIQKQKAEQEHLKRVTSGFIDERYPQVEVIEVIRKFVDFDTDKAFEKEKLVWRPTISNPPIRVHAYFPIECPMYECVDGGFDLTSVIDSMIKAKEISLSGFLTCQGWEDQGRVGQHRCLTKFNYEINIQYKKE